MRRLAVALIAVLLVAGLVAVAAQPLPTPRGASAPPSAEDYAFTVEYARWVERQGNLSVLEVAVSYYGRNVLLDSVASLEPGCNASVVSRQPVVLGSWPSGARKIIRFTVNTTGVEGRCWGTIAVKWDREWDPVKEKVVLPSVNFRRLKVDMSYCGSPQVSVRVEPATLYMGRANTLHIVVANTGGSVIRDLDVRVEVQGASVLDANYPVEVKASVLGPGGEKGFTLRIVPTSPSPVLTFRASYTDCVGDEETSVTVVPLNALRGQAVMVSPVQGRVEAGSTSSVEVKVLNLGSVSLGDAKIALSAQGAGVVVEPQLVSLGDVEPGGERGFTITVAVPATAIGSIPVTYTLSYKTPDGGVVTLGGSFTLFVVQKGQVYVTSVDTVPEEPSVGGTLVLSVNLVNDGSAPVYGVNVTASADEGLEPLRSTYSFLGRLEPQALTSVPFSYRVKAPGEHSVAFEVHYRDAYGVEHVVKRVVTVRAVASSAAGQGGGQQEASNGYGRLWPALLAAALAVVVVAVLVARRRVKRS